VTSLQIPSNDAAEVYLSRNGYVGLDGDGDGNDERVSGTPPQDVTDGPKKDPLGADQAAHDQSRRGAH
jgi:hypothetical protein